MSVSGACVTGEVRTFFSTCVGPQLCKNLLIPLQLYTHVFVNTKTENIQLVKHRLKFVLRHVNVVSLVVDETRSESAPCISHGSGYVITRQLYDCYKSIRADTSRTYDWIFRLRTDHNIRVRFKSLPQSSTYYNRIPGANGIALLSDVGGCTCGWKLGKCNDWLYSCSRVNDQFAILHGIAVEAYFVYLRQYYCDPMTLKASPFTFKKLGSEERLGLILSAYNVTIHDIRYFSSAAAPRLHRTKQCTKSDHRLLNSLNSRSMSEPIPSGPWDQRRLQVCQEQRNLPSHRRTRCFPVDDVYDDIQFKKDVMRMLK